MKMTILDGLDGSGKTWLFDELKKHYGEEEFGYRHSPSDGLIEKYLSNKEDMENGRIDFLKALLSETEEFLVANRDKKHLIVDRLTMSSFLYQAVNADLEKYIVDLYVQLFKKLGINPTEDIFYFILTKSFNPKGREVDKSKQYLDGMGSFYEKRMVRIVRKIRYEKVHTPLFSKNLVYFTSSDPLEISNIQNYRLSGIKDQIDYELKNTKARKQDVKNGD